MRQVVVGTSSTHMIFMNYCIITITKISDITYLHTTMRLLVYKHMILYTSK